MDIKLGDLTNLDSFSSFLKGKYVYIETSSPRQSGDNAKLTFKGSYSGDMCMTFYYHMYGQTINQLNIYNNNKKIFEKRGNQGNAWHKASVNLKGDSDVSHHLQMIRRSI